MRVPAAVREKKSLGRYRGGHDSSPNNARMNVTVIVCTYNRCQSLHTTLESISEMIVPEALRWKVLVVDNNSTDQTREVISDFCQRFPERFRYIHESQQGLSCARNTGIREADGEILVFTDDDIVVEPDWLVKLTSPLGNAEWVGVGGRVMAANDFKCPNWLSLTGNYNLGGVLALHEPNVKESIASRSVVGANMCFRAEVFQRHGLFRADLGRTGNSMIGNEDTEFSNRLIARGERLCYEPSAVVHHAIPAHRLTKKYFLRFWYDYGRARVRESANRSGICGIPRWWFSILLIVLNVLPIRLRLWLFARDPKQRFFFKCTVWRTFGELTELPRIRESTHVKQIKSVGVKGGASKSSVSPHK